MKTIVVTGASSGIGAALATEFASRGHRVLAVARRADKLSEVAATSPKQIIPVEADVTDENQFFKITQTLTELGATEGVYLVNNAGISRFQPYMALTRDEFNAHIALNVTAPLFLTQALATYLKHGRVLNMSSGLAHKPYEDLSSYCISKYALLGVTDQINCELNRAPYHIAAGSVMPGIVESAIQVHFREQGSFAGNQWFTELKDSGKLLKPEQAARFIAYLMFDTPDSEYIKGDHDIYNTAHHAKWVRSDEVIPLPFD